MFVIPLDENRTWYRYHHLFAGLLKQRFLHSDQGKSKDIHNKASDWFEENALHELAIDHALEIRNFERSIQILQPDCECGKSASIQPSSGMVTFCLMRLSEVTTRIRIVLFMDFNHSRTGRRV